MENKDTDVKKEISCVTCEDPDVSSVRDKMHSEESSELNDSDKSTNEIDPRLGTEKSDEYSNDCVAPFCFVGIKMEEPEAYESDGASCASSGKERSVGESPSNLERECSVGLNEKSSVQLSDPTCVDIKMESEEDIDTNCRADSTSSIHRYDMGHSSNEFVRGIECGDFPILCKKPEEEEQETREQTRVKSYNSAALRKKDGDEKSYLKKLVLTRSSDKLYSCVVCEASFQHKNSLQSHMRCHSGEKPFSCEVCGASFSEKSNHKRHLRTHTGERPFSCDRCDASFSHKSSLQSHVRSHTGEKPFRCGLCAASFSERSKQKRHMRAHSGERPFQCPTCKASFSLRSHLKRHVQTHNARKVTMTTPAASEGEGKEAGAVSRNCVSGI